MLTFRLETDEIPEIVMSRLSLRYLVVRLGFNSMNKVGELDGILNKEYWNVVADNIPVTLLYMKDVSDLMVYD